MRNSWGVVENVGQPSGRQHHTAIYDGTRMVLFGGEDASGNEFNDGYSLASNSWSPFSGSVPESVRCTRPFGLMLASIVWAGPTTGPISIAVDLRRPRTLANHPHGSKDDAITRDFNRQVHDCVGRPEPEWSG